MAAEQEVFSAACDNFWCAILTLFRAGGVGALCFLFIAYVFYSLVWRVWRAAMNSKSEEIERLVEEKNFFQHQLFSKRLTSGTRSREGED